ncbi:MAG: hypothetical protein IJK97_03335 [Thermoguttaceae bacterium]|nr:hypothetical protein [Thermoguttaceae bacterium]MBR0193407.1 hypothetical protein [Thermoguttaceae bacterium]
MKKRFAVQIGDLREKTFQSSINIPVDVSRGGPGKKGNESAFFSKKFKILAKRLYFDQVPELGNLKTIQKSAERRKNEGVPFRKSGSYWADGNWSFLPAAASHRTEVASKVKRQTPPGSSAEPPEFVSIHRD